MKGPRLKVLRRHEPLAAQCAGALLETAPSRDLSRTLVVVPTAGAARRIRFELARLGGALAPAFRLPMDALTSPDTPKLARAFERLAAWACALEGAREGGLFPSTDFLDSAPARLRTAAAFLRLEDELAEGGHSLDDAEAGRVLGDSMAWSEAADLHRAAIGTLRRAGLEDPNTGKLGEARRPAQSFERIVVACVPDLPTVFEKWALAMDGKGAAIEVLVWAPEGVRAEWDAWGRPVEVEGPFPGESSVRVFPSPGIEARHVMDFLGRAATPGDYACVVADPALSKFFALEAAGRGVAPYEPAGMKLSQSRAGRAAVLWAAWQREGRLRTLRQLCEDPAFGRWIGRSAGMGLEGVLGALDGLASECFATTVRQALDIHHEENAPTCGDEARAFRSRREFLEAVRNLPRGGVVPPPLDDPGVVGCEEVADLWEQVAHSPVVPGNLREEIFAAALEETRLFAARPPDGGFEILGWLEAPWQPASRLAVSGCAAGILPSPPDANPFLPDSAREKLGLASARARKLRDACLLACLTASRAPADFLVTFSRTGPDESPQLPSELLLRCADEELPGRILAVFEGGGEAASGVGDRGEGAVWSLPECARREPPKAVRATDFGSYLNCPLRFYFSRVLGLEAFDPRAHELDANAFGSLLHRAIENFTNSSREESRAEKIEKAVVAELESLAKKQFGSRPAPAIRIQLESAKARLRAFAGIEARERQAGWQILEAEKALREEDKLFIGPLVLLAKVDRIEVHPEHGLRILDYKTSRTPADPADAHLGPASRAFFDAAEVNIGGRARAWVNLQLPIYCHIAEHWYPGVPVRAGYFSLPADPSASDVAVFEMDAGLRESAMRCAEEISGRISRGIYWPPQNPRWDDPLEPVLSGGALEDVLDADTLRFFQGTPFNRAMP